MPDLIQHDPVMQRAIKPGLYITHPYKSTIYILRMPLKSLLRIGFVMHKQVKINDQS